MLRYIRLISSTYVIILQTANPVSISLYVEQNVDFKIINTNKLINYIFRSHRIYKINN